ncbi:ABC transporter permease subunit [Rubrimonas cliftonensis]|uniref:Peptide/nickel transport system permease protein n=1 Tax=Rubrimonas cliftonensis TaxID=89524 RepID=A0A1H4FBC1_9RHOB|nr:ABC transporter permease subunit [Rubrimonas cliftonensis]SEA94636.1 peptide/nickel transport system permease protein [Rubrimonas cliftonensis]
MSGALAASGAAPPRRRAGGFAVGAALVLVTLGFGVLAPLVVAGDPFTQSLTKALGGPDAAAPFGYDHLGRSLFHRLAHALRLSPAIAAAAVATAGAAGLLLGGLAAARGGWVDRALTLVADALLALPGLLLVLIVLAIMPGTALGFWAGLSLVLWVEFFRLTRATSRAVLASPAVEASRLLGFGPLYVLRRHLWPEIAPVMLTAAAFGAATAIMAIAALGFVSVGMRAPTPELGLMMVELLPYWREAPFALLTPVIATFTLLLGLILMAGDRAR